MLERASPIPLYHQLKQLLAARIEGGDWKPGDLIPGEIELQSTYALSRTTVRQALRELELDGRLTRYRGRGTFVAGPKLTHGLDARDAVDRDMIAHGMRPGWRVLRAGMADVSPVIAQRLQLAAPRAFELRRLRLANDEPIAVHVAHVAPELEATLDPARLADGPSLGYLQSATRDVTSGAVSERLLDAVPASDDEAALLDVDPGAPLLRIRRLLLDRAGRPLEHCVATYRGDRFQYHLRSPAAAPERDQE
jgi:GntR family transcriptional regulator